MVSRLRTGRPRLWAVAVLVVAAIGVTGKPAPATAQAVQSGGAVELRLMDSANASIDISAAVPRLADLGWNDRASWVGNFSDTKTFALYVDDDYRGRCLTVLPHQLTPLNFGGLIVRAGEPSSVRVGPCGQEIVFFSDPYYDTIHSGSTCSGWSCLYDRQDPARAEVYWDPSSARAFSVYGNSGSDLGSMADDAESILLPYGGVAAVYTGENRTGYCYTVTREVDDLAHTLVAVDYSNDISSFVLGRGCSDGVYTFTSPGFIGEWERRPSAGGNTDVTGRASLFNATGASLTVYAGPNFTGSCRRVGPNRGLDTVAFRSYLLNGPCPVGGVWNVGVALFADPGYGGRVLNLTASSANVGTNNFDNWASSVVNATDQVASLHVDTNYFGGCIDVPPHTSIADLGSTPISTKTISSVQIGVACQFDIEVWMGDSQVSGSVITPSRPLFISADTPALTGADNDQATFVRNKRQSTVAVFREWNYRGVCQNVAPNQPDSDLAIIGRFTMSSVRLSSPCPQEVYLFDAVDFGGANATLTSSSSDLGDWSARGSSVVNNTRQPVSLYSMTNFRGRCLDVPPGTSVANLIGSVVGNDLVRSVRVGSACKANLLIFDGRDYTGTFAGWPVDKPDLSQFGFRASSLSNATGQNVAVYRAINYSGVLCQNVPAGAAFPDLSEQLIGNNTLLSFDVGGRCPPRVIRFTATGFSGTAYVHSQSTANLPKLDADNATQSIANNLDIPVAVYDGPYFQGTCLTLPPGAYFADLSTSSLGNNAASSMRIGATC